MSPIRIAEYIRQKAAISRRPNTYKRALRNTANKLEEFEKFLGRSLYTNEFSAQMMEEFEYFLKNDIKNYRRSTILSFTQKLSQFLRKASRENYEVDFSFEEHKVPAGEVYSVALTEEELEAIYHLKLPKEQRVARFWLILNCYTGFRFSDLKRINGINIARDSISMRTKKTNVEVKIPLHWMIISLIEENKGVIPPLKTQQNYGAIIKRICRKAKINDRILIERHEGNKFIRKTFPKWKLVSAHTARRSFATNAYLAGISIARIMLLTGHKTEEAFFKYICIEKNENAKILKKHNFFAGSDKIHNFARNKEEVKKSTEKRQKVALVLKSKRKQKGLSVNEVAEKIGCKNTTLERIEKGVFSPDADVLYAICEALDISIKFNDTEI